MPVRVVTEGGSPVRIVTSGGDPVRIVTSGISDPVRVIGGGLAPDAPTFVSGEVGTVDASTIVVTFSTDISAPCGDCALGFTVLVNGAPDAITACVIVGGNTVQLTLTTAVAFGDVVTISYDSTVGCIMESTGVTDLATFAAQAVTNNVGNGLLNNLVAYWPGNEANGNALDMHLNALTLTDQNTVTNAAGKVYATARQYTAATNEYHFRVDNALLRTGDIDFTIAIWVYADSLGAERIIYNKWTTAGNLREYLIEFYNTSNRFRFWVSNNGTATVSVDANTLGIPATTTWYLIIAHHDSVANVIGIQVNNGAIDTQAHATGVFAGTAEFRVGILSGAVYGPWNGRIGPTMFWKSPAGGGGVLTAAQRTALYNAGAGLPYASFVYASPYLRMVIFDGASLTLGTGSTVGNDYPNQTLALIGSQWRMFNFAVSGQTTTQMTTDAATQIDVLYNAAFPKDVVIPWEITNELYNGVSAADAYAHYVTYCQGRQAAGFQVVAVTVLPCSSVGTPPGFEAARQTVNTNIRTNFATFADALADVAADTNIGDAGDELDLTYYNADHVHMNDTGYGVVAGIVATAIGTL